MRVVGQADRGILYLDGNELIGPFVFKTDGRWLLLDAHLRAEHGESPVENLILEAPSPYVPPDSTVRSPSEVMVVVDDAIARGRRDGLDDVTLLALAIRRARSFPDLVDSARVQELQVQLYFRAQQSPQVFEVRFPPEPPLSPRAEFLRAAAESFRSDLARGWVVLRGTGYAMSSLGPDSARIAAKADSLRRGFDQAWPLEYEWARIDIRSPRPLDQPVRKRK